MNRIIGLSITAVLTYSAIITSTYAEEEKIKSNITIQFQNIQEEFENLIYQISQVPFYKEHGYSPSLSSHSVFENLVKSEAHINAIQKMINDEVYPLPDDYVIHDITIGKLKEVFESEVYSKLDYHNGIRILTNEKHILQSAIDSASVLSNNWGFKTFPQYKILLTKYGVGGSYNETNGSIILLLSRFEKWSENEIQSTLVHEMVHLGIEESIIERYGLTQWEKERLVYLICTFYFNDISPDYSMQNKGDDRIDEFVNAASIKSLPVAIESYVKKFPRE